MAPSDEHSPAVFPLQVTVTDVASTRVTVAFDWTDIDGRSTVRRYLGEDRVGFGLVKLFNPLPHERRRKAVERLRGDENFREVLTGQRALTFTQPRVAESTPKDRDLNQEQRAAAKFALLADDLFCIHGPPGSGKTRTLVEIVRRAVEAGESVLVCADSNQAVDNVLVGESTVESVDPGSLHAHGQHERGEFTVTRHNVRQSDREVVSRWYGDARGGADVVAATNGSAATLERQFDLVVVDEATQATVATSAIPLTKADTVVLAETTGSCPPTARPRSHPPRPPAARCSSTSTPRAASSRASASNCARSTGCTAISPTFPTASSTTGRCAPASTSTRLQTGSQSSATMSAVGRSVGGRRLRTQRRQSWCRNSSSGCVMRVCPPRRLV